MNYQKLFYGTGAPERHRKFKVKDNTCNLWADSYSKLKEAVYNNGLIGCIGNRGSGKTQASTVMIAKMSSIGKSSKYIKAFEIFLAVRDSNSGKSSLSLIETFESFVKPHLLVIDAFQVRADTDFETRTLLSLLDKRYDKERPTILVSNDTATSFLASLDKDGKDRITEGGGLIEFISPSFRRINS